MVQTNTENIRSWSCRAQWPYSQITVSKVHQSISCVFVGGGFGSCQWAASWPEPFIRVAEIYTNPIAAYR